MKTHHCETYIVAIAVISIFELTAFRVFPFFSFSLALLFIVWRTASAFHRHHRKQKQKKQFHTQREPIEENMGAGAD